MNIERILAVADAIERSPESYDASYYTRSIIGFSLMHAIDRAAPWTDRNDAIEDCRHLPKTDPCMELSGGFFKSRAMTYLDLDKQTAIDLFRYKATPEEAVAALRQLAGAKS